MKSKFNILFEQIIHQINESDNMFDELRPEYLKRCKMQFDVLANDNDILKAAKRVQMSMAKNQIAKLQEADYTTFVNKYILFQGEE